MAVNLANIVQTYLEDDAFHENWRRIIERRESSIPLLKNIVNRFIDGQTDIKTFREEIDNGLRKIDDWGATGTGWLMEINKLAKYYDSIGEAGLRQILNGLNATNVGERIEQFYNFAVQQKERLKQERISGQVAPGNSAFIVSLFAFWLDQAGRPYICYISLRQALKQLLDAGLLPQSAGLRTNYNSVEVRTEADYKAVQQALESLGAQFPKIRQPEGYWAEKFMRWINDNPSVLLDDDDVVTPNPGPIIVIDHAPLPAIPAALLPRLIAAVRAEILVDEAVVRRIYHALLAGHVILTGPPGTGKTELARLIPELLWQTEEAAGSSADPYGNPIAQRLTQRTAYTTRLVTATDEWSVRTLIGGITPTTDASGGVTYRTRPGFLTETLLDNWAVNKDQPNGWRNPQRNTVRGASVLNRDGEQEFRGRWLVIDEFNRAPIDLALGEALTALGGAGVLRVPVDGGSAELPLPQDFRIIGTLNSFDRNYLNQISEALKRRFAFVEILPPPRQDRNAELAIVLQKTLASIRHLVHTGIDVAPDRSVRWSDVVNIRPDQQRGYSLDWYSDINPAPAREVIESAWRAFEVIRVYRQLGTAQAIALFKHMLIACIVQEYRNVQDWYAALDQALCDTIADQLQVLLPDELEVLIWYSTLDADEFIRRFNQKLADLQTSNPRRMLAQLEALAAVTDDHGNQLLSEADVQQRRDGDPSLPAATLRAIFRLDPPNFALPQFARRLRAFTMERGL